MSPCGEAFIEPLSDVDTENKNELDYEESPSPIRDPVRVVPERKGKLARHN